MLKFAFVSPGLCNFGQLVAPHLNEIFIWGSLISNYSMCPYKSNHYVLKNRKQASICDSFLIINYNYITFFSFVLGFKGGRVFLNISFIRNFKMDLKAKNLTI